MKLRIGFSFPEGEFQFTVRNNWYMGFWGKVWGFDVLLVVQGIELFGFVCIIDFDRRFII